jgi:glycine betaine/proline transport system substrate-binding protein
MTIKTRNFTRPLLAACLLTLTLGAHAAADLPGKGIKVQPLKSSLAEETFQTLLVNRALAKLGYDVQPIKEVEYATAHIAIANGDATFMADHWNPQQDDYFKNAGGKDKLSRQGVYSNNAAQGYVIDKKTADAYKITNIGQLKDPKIAKLFDTDGDGKADLTGCTPGWACENIIDHHIDAYKLQGTVSHKQGTYAALIADTITRFKQGEPVIYYTWTPYWVSAVLRPGKDVVWLDVPFSSLPGKGTQVDTRQPSGKNYGFVVNTQHIVASKDFVTKNLAAGKLFEIMKVSVNDINAQNLRMSQGENTLQDIERHTDGWIRSHQKTFDSWISKAMDAAKK